MQTSYKHVSAVPLGTLGRVRVHVWLSHVWWLVSCLLKGPHPPGPRNSHTPFFTLFASCFQTPFFTAINAPSPQNGSLKTPQNHKNTQKNVVKAHPRTRHAKRPRLEGAKPLKMMTVSQFWLFFQSPRAPKNEVKTYSKWSLRAPKNVKKQEKGALAKNTKNATPKSGSLLAKWPPKWTSFSRLKCSQNHNIP